MEEAKLSKNLLELSDLRTYYHTSTGIVRAVDGVNLRIKKGRAIGLVGESGCGKTTLASSILRLLPVVQGEMIWRGRNFKNRNLLELSENEMRQIRGKEISMIFQDPLTYLNPVFKVGVQIMDVISLHEGCTKEDAEKKAITLLNEVRMPYPEQVMEMYPHQLSGGMRQRAVIAIALSSNPLLLIADEPTTALDVTVQAKILGLICNLIDKLGISLLLITHDLGVIAEVCDEIYVMYAGKIVEYAEVHELYYNCKHPYTTGLIKSVLSINEAKKKFEVIPGTVPNLIDPPPGCRFHPRCPVAMQICREYEPSPTRLNSKHEVSCFRYNRM